MKYRVAWKIKATGFTGHGRWVDDYATVSAWVKYGNDTCSEVFHWLETKAA